MASRETRLNIDVTASDHASSVVRDVATEIDKVEGEHEVDITASDRASDALAGIRDKLELLTESDKRIVLNGEVSGLEREIRKAERVLRDIGKYDGDTIRISLEARDNASKKLEAVQTELRQLEGETARVSVDASGAESMDAALQSMLGGKAGAVGWGGLAAMIAGGAYQANQMALEVQTVANLTGSSLDQASRMVAVWRDNGLEVGDLLDILLNVQGQLASNPELAAQLGVELGENNNLIDTFLQAVAGISTGYDTAGDRAQAASTLFGEEGVRQVGKVQVVVGDLTKALEEIPEARIVNPADVDTAREMNAELAEFRGHIDAAGLAMLPFIARLNDALALGGDIGGRIKGWLDAIPGVEPQDVLTGGPLGAVPAAVTRGTTGAIDRIPGVNVPNWVPGADEGGGDAPAPWWIRNITNQVVTNIINPPGTPAATADQNRQYLTRNGVR